MNRSFREILDAFPRVALGSYPTPVKQLDSGPFGELWLKNDGVTSLTYGGNKVRKLELLLACAKARGAARVLTVGAAGSHHVLATAVHAKPLGLAVSAIVSPQPHSKHAEHTLMAAVHQGAEILPTTHPLSVLRDVARRRRHSDYFIGPGGLGRWGSLAYASAALELAEQVAKGELGNPGLIVVAAGSGSTAAGLLAGTLLAELHGCQILAVQVSRQPGLRSVILGQAKLALRQLGAGAPLSELNGRLIVSRDWAGRGYGFGTGAGDQAKEIAGLANLQLDDTYTTKSFAAALSAVGRGAKGRKWVRRYSQVVYWHTLSSAGLEPLLVGARPLRRSLRQLLTPSQTPESPHGH